MNNLEKESFQTCLHFLETIGIKTAFRTAGKNCFLPGLEIERGTIFIDMDALQFPGDILHEAGHLAVIPPAERQLADAAAFALRPDREAEEMMAIAWSYAACVHLGLDPSFVFHDDGYKGGGGYIAENFNNKNYFGLPMLQWIGLTYDETNAIGNGREPYPAMIKWLRD